MVTLLTRQSLLPYRIV